MSKTQQSYWGKGTVDPVTFELQNVEDKLNRGFSNSVMMRQMKSQKVRNITTRAPDVESLRKKEEEKQYAVWETYLLKSRDIVKNQKKNEKLAKEMADADAEKKQEKIMKIQTNIKNVASEMNEHG